MLGIKITCWGATWYGMLIIITCYQVCAGCLQLHTWTNCISRVFCVAAIPRLQYVAHVTFFPHAELLALLFCNFYYYYYYYYCVIIAVSCHRPFLPVTASLKPTAIPTAQTSVSDCSTFRIMCDVSRIAVFCSECLDVFLLWLSELSLNFLLPFRWLDLCSV